jgi:PKD repeat protein
MPGTGFFPEVGIYTGGSLGSLTEVACRFGAFPPLLFQADAGTTYYIQVGNPFNDLGSVTISLDEAPPPTADFLTDPNVPSIFDTTRFITNVFDPAGGSFASYEWDFGDGTTATVADPITTHRYAADGDYTVTLIATTSDGRTASVQHVVSVSTHDVTIAKVTTPNSAQSEQTRQISVGLTNTRYSEIVRVDLYKNAASGSQFELVGSLIQTVPVRGGNRTTAFDFSYTFTAQDAAVGKVTFKVIATLLNARDALPADNEVVASSTKVTK